MLVGRVSLSFNDINILPESSLSALEEILLKVVPKDHQEKLVREIRSLARFICRGWRNRVFKRVEAHGKDWGYQPKHEVATKIITCIVKALMGVQVFKESNRLKKRLH